MHTHTNTHTQAHANTEAHKQTEGNTYKCTRAYSNKQKTQTYPGPLLFLSFILIYLKAHRQ